MPAILSRWRPLSKPSERKLRLGVAGLGRAFTVMLPTFTGDPRVTAGGGGGHARRGAAAFCRGLLRQKLTQRSRSFAPIRPSRRFMSRRRINSTRSTPTLAAQHGKHLLDRKTDGADARRMRQPSSMRRERAGVHARRRPQPFLRCAGSAPARSDRERRFRPCAHDQRHQLHGLSLSPAPSGRARHSEGRRRGVQPGSASGRHCAADRRRPGRERARGSRRRGMQRARPKAPMRRCSRSQNGAFASLTYSGYGHFDSDEFQGWIGEMGADRRRLTPARPASFRHARRMKSHSRTPATTAAPNSARPQRRLLRTSISAPCW